MSNKMPNKTRTEPFPFNNFTRDKKSNKIIKDLIFKVEAYITAERVAKASAINSGETKSSQSFVV